MLWTELNHMVEIEMKPQKIKTDVLLELNELQKPGEESFLKQMILLFIDSSKNRTQSIAQAKKEQDFRRIADETHALKSSALRVGAFDLAHACETFESTSEKETNPAILNALADKVLEEHVAAIAELNWILISIGNHPLG